MRIKFLITVFISLIFPPGLIAFQPGTPPVLNYTRSVYQAAGKNWSVTQDSDGIMFFGNDNGLLEYDGLQWKLHPFGHNQRVRSVHYDASSNRLYAGSYEEFGFFKRKDNGILVYHSLSDGLDDRNSFTNEDIWQILSDRNKVYFQSFGNIFIWDKLTEKIDVLDPPASLMFIFKPEDEIIGQMIGRGLFYIREGEIEDVPGTEALSDHLVHSILPCGNGGYIIGTSAGGLFTYYNGTLEYLNSPASSFLKANQLNKGLKGNDGLYIYGTILNGLVIIDSKGNIISKIDTSRGLQNSTVLSLFRDNMNNVWAGLNMGIDRIMAEAPYTIFTDRSGKIGAVITAAMYRDNLYIGTNQGVFYLPWDELGPDNSVENFQMVPNTGGITWELKVFGDQLLCGHNKGTFLIRGPDDVTMISSVTGGWNMVQVDTGGKEFLIQSTYTHLAVYDMDNSGRWRFSHTIDGFRHPARYLAFDIFDNLWISHSNRGVFRARLNPALDSITQLNYYENPDGGTMHVFKVGNMMLFTTGSRIYSYDHLTGNFHLNQLLTEELGEFSTSHRIKKDIDENYWFINKERFAFASLKNGRLEIVERHYPDQFNINLVEVHGNVVAINDTMRLFGLDNGFALFNLSGHDSGTQNPNRLIMRKINASSGLLPLINGDNIIRMPFKNNFINFEFSMPGYSPSPAFRYILEGLDNEWHETRSAGIGFNRLPPGKYTFRVAALQLDDSLIDEISYSFSVGRPWYASLTALSLYFVSILITLFFIRIYHKRRFERKVELLRINVQKEKEEQLRVQNLENEKIVIALENKRLEEEIRHKSKQLANSTVGIIKKNEILKEIKGEIIKRARNDNSFHKSIDEVISLININLKSDEDWQVFLSNFDIAHENFLRRLKERYSDLTPKELRFCAYLRMNISSKEIASLLNMSVRGVEIKRYRLRKKLQLKPEQDLVEFMMDI